MLTLLFKTVFHWLCPPQVFDFWMERFNINRRWQSPTARVVSCSVIANDFIRLILKPSRLFSGFYAGQHISLSGVVNGVRVERCYSIANLPNSQNLIELSIKIQGHFSRWLSQSVSKGDVLEISDAWGENHRYEYDVYIAGGIGITAILPLVKNIASLRPKGTINKVKLIYLVNEQRAGLYRNSVLALASKHINVVVHDGRTALEKKQWLSGQINSKARVLSCGSQGFNEAVNAQLKDRVNRLDLENFNIDALTPEVDERSISKKKAITIRLKKTGKTLVSDNQQPVIKALLEGGVPIKKGCRQGVCHQCSCQLSQGHVIQQQQDIKVAAVGSAKHTFQPCIARAQSDIELNL